MARTRGRPAFRGNLRGDTAGCGTTATAESKARFCKGGDGWPAGAGGGQVTERNRGAIWALVSGWLTS